MDHRGVGPPQRDHVAARLIEIAVTDTGTGIAPEILPQIFTRFYQGDEPDGARQSGRSGLGLAIVKQPVGARGGTSIRFALPRG